MTQGTRYGRREEDQVRAELAERPRPRAIRSETFAQALADAGVIADDPATIHRIVIDARAGSILMLYLERFGDERLLNVAMTLDGIEVRTGHPAAAGDEHVTVSRTDVELAMRAVGRGRDMWTQPERDAFGRLRAASEVTA